MPSDARPRLDLRLRVLAALSASHRRQAQSASAPGSRARSERCTCPARWSGLRPRASRSGRCAGTRLAGIPRRQLPLLHDPGPIPKRDLVRRPFLAGDLEHGDRQGRRVDAALAARGSFVHGPLRYRYRDHLEKVGALMPRSSMRSIFAAALFAFVVTSASAGEPLAEIPVSAGGFGMSGADYYGDVRSRMPFTREEPPRPLGIADIERVRAARRRAEATSRRVDSRHRPRRRSPHA